VREHISFQLAIYLEHEVLLASPARLRAYRQRPTTARVVVLKNAIPKLIQIAAAEFLRLPQQDNLIC
jgi:hypothetical protein